MTSSVSEPAASAFTPVEAPYLLLTFIPYYVDDAGTIWLGLSWHRDFVRHLEYVRNLTLVAPRLPYQSDISDLVPFEPPAEAEVRFAALPAQTSALAALIALPRTISTLWREIGRAEIVHSGIIGWPFPLGWIANPIALRRGKRLVLVVESAPWRLATAGPHGWKKRLRAAITERLGRFFIRRADLSIFTQPSYRDSLLGSDRRGAGHVIPASWINEDEILPRERVLESWEARCEAPAGTVRLLFPARLTREKGVAVLLEAARRLESQGLQARLDIIGDGALREECAGAAAEMSGANFAVRLLDPVPYGEPFFSLLRNYHAALVPSLSDEQPRIIFDARAQGVPVIASATDGIRPHVEAGETGWLVEPGNPAALATAITEAVENPQECKRRGLAAHRVAQSLTHREMHRTRSELLARLCA